MVGISWEVRYYCFARMPHADKTKHRAGVGKLFCALMLGFSIGASGQIIRPPRAECFDS